MVFLFNIFIMSIPYIGYKSNMEIPIRNVPCMIPRGSSGKISPGMEGTFHISDIPGSDCHGSSFSQCKFHGRSSGS